jgi:manganese/zinc/iron transport system permease protein
MTAFLSLIEVQIALTGGLLALSGALVGTFLVLRGQSLATDAIAHAIVLGIVVVWLLTGLRAGPVAVAGAAGAGLAAVLGAQALTRSGLMRGDAAVGLVFSSMFALGVLLISAFARNIHLDVDTVLLGEIGLVWLDMRSLGGVELPLAVWTLAAVGALNAAFVALFWKELKLASFDPGLAQSLGFNPAWLERALLALTALTAVAAFEAVGVVLFLAFVIVPALAASLLARSLAGVLALAVGFGLLAVGVGLRAGFALDVNLGGAMALATGLGLAGALVLSPRAGLVALLTRQRAGGRAARVEALLVHLASHAGTPDQRRENRPEALTAHLGWSDARARATTLDALDGGLIARAGDELALTETGQARADHLARAHDRRAALPPEGGTRAPDQDATNPQAGPTPETTGPSRTSAPQPKA